MSCHHLRPQQQFMQEHHDALRDFREIIIIIKNISLPSIILMTADFNSIPHRIIKGTSELFFM